MAADSFVVINGAVLECHENEDEDGLLVVCEHEDEEEDEVVSVDVNAVTA